MSFINKLRAGLHRKTWEGCTPAPLNSVTGGFLTIADDPAIADRIYGVFSASSIWCYSPKEDAWHGLPSSGVAGAFAIGSCGEALGLGMLGGSHTSPITAGTTTTLTTVRTVVRRLPGVKVRVVAGTGIGYEGTITTNTLGANSVLTVTPASAVAFDATTVISIYSGSLWFMNAGTTAVGFSVYDRATNAWTAKSVTNLPTAWGTWGQLVSTRSAVVSAEAGTSSGANTTTTLNHTGKTWVTNAWANYQVRITAGVGIGQVRTIASNAATALTVSAAWTTTPDATSVYSIEGNDDSLYLLGNNAVTLYRYSISGNTWATITPGSARAGALGAGGTADWVGQVDAWAQGATTAAVGGQQKGRFIYSFRGAGSSVLDVYDIALNTWTSLSYGSQSETFTTGSCSAYDGRGRIIVMKEATGRYFSFDVDTNRLGGLTSMIYPQSTAISMDMIAVDPYVDGSDRIDFLYSMCHSRPDLFRMLLIKE